MASQMYNEGKENFANATCDWVSDTIQLILCMNLTDADTVNDAIEFVADISLDECDSASGYARATLGTKAVTKVDANDSAKVTAADVVFTALATCTRTIQGAVIYKFVTSDALSPVIGWVEFPAPVTPDGSDFTITWHADGIFYMN